MVLKGPGARAGGWGETRAPSLILPTPSVRRVSLCLGGRLLLQRFALLLSHPPFYACFSSERTSCTSLAYPWRDWFNFTANRCRRCVIAVKLSPLGPLSAPLGTGLPRSRLPRCQLSPRCLGRYPKPHKPLDTAILLACLSLLQTVSLPAPVMPSML